MKFAFFTVPVSDEVAAKALNSFCSNHRIVTVDKHFVAESGFGYWTFCITYLGTETASMGGKRKVDYKEVLSEQDFTVFAELRGLRKEVAERAGVPAYAVFTNEQLASFVRDKAMTKEAMERVPGVGSSKIRNYAEVFLPVLIKFFGKEAD